MCICLYFNNLISQTQKQGVREKERKTKVNIIWHGPNGCLLDISSQGAFYLSAACHIVTSTPHTTRFQKETNTVLKKIKEKWIWDRVTLTVIIYLWRNFSEMTKLLGIFEKIVFPSLIFVVDLNMNLMSKLHYKCERREYHSPYSRSI